jgi:LacI family transcriptional regulator, repressor for deo operon, udp, cdd, tsx, nupC, and nupG
MVSRIEDVARAAGVSTATVSRALRGLPRVSAATRAKVVRAAADLQYVASPTASSLASGRTQLVGVVVPYVTRWYFAQLISGASGVLRERGFHALLFDVDDEGPQRVLLLDSRMLFKRVDALAVLSLRLHEDERRLLRQIKVPVVTVGVPDPDWPCVRIDDVATIGLAVGHLIGLGHRRIGYVGGSITPELGFPTPSDRELGFRLALTRAGLMVPARYLTTANWTPEGGLAAGHRLLGAADRPTAIACASDEMAFGVLRAAVDLGLSVPHDLSVTGIDDHQLAALQGLTTVGQDPAEQGRVATRLLLGAIGGDPLGREVTTMATRLIIRSSTAVPRLGPATRP